MASETCISENEEICFTAGKNCSKTFEDGEAIRGAYDRTFMLVAETSRIAGESELQVAYCW